MAEKKKNRLGTCRSIALLVFFFFLFRITDLACLERVQEEVLRNVMGSSSLFDLHCRRAWSWVKKWSRCNYYSPPELLQ